MCACRDALQNLRGAGSVASTPLIASGEPGREIVRVNGASLDQGLAEVDGHLCVIGPSHVPFPSPPDDSPQEPLGRATLEWRPERVAQRQSQEAALDAIG